MINPEALHTLSVCTSILAGFVGVIGTIWKMVTNHFAHMKVDIIKNADDNAERIVLAVKDSTISIVSALKK